MPHVQSIASGTTWSASAFIAWSREVRNKNHEATQTRTSNSAPAKTYANREPKLTVKQRRFVGRKTKREKFSRSRMIRRWLFRSHQCRYAEGERPDKNCHTSSVKVNQSQVDRVCDRNQRCESEHPLRG